MSWVGDDVREKAEAAAKPYVDQTKADFDEQRRQRDAITNRLNGAQPVEAPKAAPTVLGAAQTAGPVAPGAAAQVGQTTLGAGQRQVVQAPVVPHTGPVVGTTVAAPIAAPVTAAQAARVGPAATAVAPGGIGTTLMAAAPVAQTVKARAATIAPIAEATAPTVARTTLGTGASDEVRAKQLAITQALEAGAAGNGPSAALSLMQLANEKAKREQMGLAVARAHGGSVGLAQREAGENISNIEAQGAAQAAALKAKEQQDAQGRLLQALESTRGQDIGLITKAADLSQGANLTEAELSSRTGLANLDVRAKTALTEGQFEQEARQANAAREQQTNLTASGYAQEANKTNSGEQNLASRTTYATEAEAAQAQAARDQAVAIEQARNQQAANLLNATEANKAGDSAADRALKAGLANQTTDLSAKTTTAEITSREGIERAGLEAKVAMDNAARELDALKQQSILDQQRGIKNADLEQQINIKAAELESATSQFNASERNKANIAQGDITSRESLSDQDAIIKQRAIDQQREQALTNAALDANRDIVGGERAAWDAAAQRRAQSDAADKQLFGSLIGSGASALALSDERRKEQITDILTGEKRDDLMEAFDAIRPSKFKYKDPGEPGARPGERYGVIAQDLEKTPAGRSIVREADDGTKMIDVGPAVAMALAAIADMRARMKTRKR